MDKFPKRKPMHLEGFDYKTPTFYFITLCVNGRRNLLGEISQETFVPSNDSDIIIARSFSALCESFPGSSIDSYVIMPNHLHFLIFKNNEFDLIEIVKFFKVFSTKLFSREIFDNRFWQKNFYDHIVRNDEDLMNIRKYISNNPKRWYLDSLFVD